MLIGFLCLSVAIGYIYGAAFGWLLVGATFVVQGLVSAQRRERKKRARVEVIRSISNATIDSPALAELIALVDSAGDRKFGVSEFDRARDLIEKLSPEERTGDASPMGRERSAVDIMFCAHGNRRSRCEACETESLR